MTKENGGAVGAWRDDAGNNVWSASRPGQRTPEATREKHNDLKHVNALQHQREGTIDALPGLSTQDEDEGKS